MKGLENKTNQLIAKMSGLRRGQGRDQSAVNDHIAAIRSIHKANKVQQSALTRARRPYNARHFTRTYTNINIA